MKHYNRLTHSPIHYALVLLLPWGALAQPPTSSRPKIGVALEGGGALGFAHIGVLKWFEEHKIPIDYIAGTSMGGLVGGLYATGMSPDEIRELVSKIDWNDTISGQVSFRDLSYRRKEDRRAFQNGLEFGLRDGFGLPSGLASDKNITFLLDREVLLYSQLKTFDELPIPFRCVATDLATGKPVVFKDGPLGEALRATMSLPAVFPPLQRNGTLYADGGLMDNLPVEVVRKMGADIVIAVNLSVSPFRTQGNQSMVAVLNRSISAMITVNELRSMELADVVINADLQGYTGTDYGKFEKIISQGYNGAEQKSSLLARLGTGDPGWQQYETARDSRKIHTVPVPEFVQVAGVDGQLSRDVEKTLQSNVGQPVDTRRIEQDINVISGNGRFYGFSYAMAERDGRPGLVFRANEKQYAPPIVNLGVLIDGSDLGNVRFTTNARITALDFGGYRSELRTDVSVGSSWGLGTEYYRPLTATSDWFVAPRVSANSNPLDLYDHGNKLAEYRIRQVGGGLDLGYAIDRFSEIRLGYDSGYLDASLRVGDAVLPTPSGRVGATSIRYSLNRLDNPIVPRSGEVARLRTQWNDATPGAPGGFPLAEVSFGLVHRISRPGSVYVQGFGGTTFGHRDTGLPQFFLGGYDRLNAYGTNELRTDQYWLARVGYIHELFTLPPVLGNKVYATAGYEVGKAYAAPGASRLPNDGSVGVVIETLLGPIGVGGSLGDSGHHKVYFSVGRFF